MEYALSFAMLIVEQFSLCLLADSLFPARLRSRPALDTAIFGFSLCGFFLLTVLPPLAAPLPKTAATLLIFFLLLNFCYRPSWKEALLLEILFYTYLTMIDDCMMLLFMSLSRYSYPELLSNQPLYLCGAFASKLIELTGCFLLYRIRKARKSGSSHLTLTSWILLLLTPVFSLMVDLALITHAIRTGNIGSWTIVTTVGLLFCNVAVVFLWEQLDRERQSLLEKELLLQSAQSDREKAAALSAAYRQQRSQTHDFQSHMQAIAALLSAGEFGRAQQYAQNWARGAPHPSDSLISTNNALVDLLLGQKFAAAQEQGIAFHLLADDLAQLPMPDADFVAVLSNLADNAIEAAARCAGEKAVHIKLQRSPNGEFILSVRNTSPPVSIVDGAIQTNKPDTLAHGFGLENAKRILAQNGGESVLFQKDGWVQFTAKITNYAE